MKNTGNPIEIMTAFLNDYKAIEKEIKKMLKEKQNPKISAAKKVISKISSMKGEDVVFWGPTYSIWVDFNVDVSLLFKNKPLPRIKATIEFTQNGLKFIY